MPRLNPDKSLRRLVADLAMLHADDIAAILSDLSAAERRSVEDLLREHADLFVPPPVPVAAPAEEKLDTKRLSPWLAERLAAPDLLTAETRAALRDLVVELNAMPPAPLPARPRRRFGWRKREAVA